MVRPILTFLSRWVILDLFLNLLRNQNLYQLINLITIGSRPTRSLLVGLINVTHTQRIIQVILRHSRWVILDLLLNLLRNQNLYQLINLITIGSRPTRSLLVGLINVTHTQRIIQVILRHCDRTNEIKKI